MEATAPTSTRVQTHPAHRDLLARFAPSTEQTDVAAAVLDQMPGVVIVPVALPGKRRGVWEFGQRVEHPAGFWYVADNDSDGYSEAREAADEAAGRYLAAVGGGGVSAYAVIQPGEAGWAVFEGIHGTPVV